MALRFFCILVFISFQLTAQSPRVLKKATKLIEKTFAVDDLQLEYKEFQTKSVLVQTWFEILCTQVVDHQLQTSFQSTLWLSSIPEGIGLLAEKK